MFIESAKQDNENESDDNDDRRSTGSGGGAATGSKEPENKVNLIIDAACAPADIAFPTDLELSDKARRWTETILNRYWILFGSLNERNDKPRTYMETARQRYLKLNKRRRKSIKKIGKELRSQLRCIRRNLNYIEAYAIEYGLDCLFRVKRERLLTIVEFYSQQKEMLDTKTHRITDRIVSLLQPWIRPIVRGKSKAPI